MIVGVLITGLAATGLMLLALAVKEETASGACNIIAFILLLYIAGTGIVATFTQ